MQSGAIPMDEPPRQQDDLARDLERFLRQLENTEVGEDTPLKRWLDLAESWKIARTLRECRGNRSAAARKLGIGRRTLYAKMEKLEITPTWL